MSHPPPRIRFVPELVLVATPSELAVYRMLLTALQQPTKAAKATPPVTS